MYVIFDKVMHDLHHELPRNLVINFHEVERITITQNKVWLYYIIDILLKIASTYDNIWKFIIYI